MSNFSETALYEAFGIEPPAADPAAAEPAAEEATPAAQDGQAPAAAEPSQEQPDAAADPDDGSQTQTGGEDPAKKPQTEDERRANAARRRKQEQQLAIDQAVQAERDRANAAMADLLARAGLKNSITGQPITTIDEFNAWEQAFKLDKAERELKAGKLSKDTLDNLISQHPTVQAAAKVVQESEDAKQQAEIEAARVRVDADIQKISQLDPTIQSMEDILALPTAPAFYQYVQKNGLGVLDAFRLANQERLDVARTDAARQQALSNNRGKSHLTATGNARGNGAMFVPADEMALFRLFNPKASEAEIQAYYNKNKQK